MDDMKKMINKLYTCDHISDEELKDLIHFLSDLEMKLFAMPKEFSLAYKEVCRLSEMCENFQFYRQKRG